MIIIKCDRCESETDVKKNIFVGERDQLARDGVKTLYGPLEMCEACIKQLKSWMCPPKAA